MGCSTSRPTPIVSQLTFAVVGLDNAGKSTVVNNLIADYQGQVAPTLGFCKQQLRRGRYDIVFYDLGGSSTIRGYWNNYYPEVFGIIFVIDSSDIERLQEIKEALGDLLSSNLLKGKPILIFANKQDLPTSLAVDEIVNRLGIDQHHNSSFHIEPCVAYVRPGTTRSGPGVDEPDVNIQKALDWIVSSVEKDYSKLSDRIHKDVEEWKINEAKRKEEQKLRVAQYRAERENDQQAVSNTKSDIYTGEVEGKVSVKMSEDAEGEPEGSRHRKFSKADVPMRSSDDEHIVIAR